MSKQKPSIPKGTRDFGPAEMVKRHFILDTIKKVYQKYGYEPIETPAMENLSVLQGKYGDEGDQLLFKILNSGDFLDKYYKSNTKFIEYTHKLKLFFQEQLIPELLKVDTNNTSLLTIIENNIFAIENSQNYSKEEIGFLKTAIKSIDNRIIDYLRLEKKSVELEDKVAQEIEFSKRVASLASQFIALVNKEEVNPYISEKGLRYDLTVPFARFVVMNQHKLTFPFKRYQIQPVWRADRPQRGRYREFYQCDADAIGTNSMLCEAEIILMIQEVFKSLQAKKANSLDYAIKINNRKILSGIVEVMGAKGKETDFAVAIDKLDKIGEEKVKVELQERDFDQSAIAKISPLFSLNGSNQEQLTFLKEFLADSEVGKRGLAELTEVFEIVESFGVEVPELELDVTLARGLSYYTGAIFEVKPKNVQMGSICGGGRYDGLTDTFGLPDVSGVGISFGVDRIYDVLEELELYPENAESSTAVLLVSFDAESWKYTLKVLHRLRAANIKAELYPEPVKLKKQMKYANDKQIPYVILVGSDEMKTGDLTFKNMTEGTQENLQAEDILKRFLGYE